MTTELLRLENITCHGDQNLPLVQGVSFAVNAGQVLWVTGSMGMGKTTLLEVIVKERKPDIGNVFFQSQPLWGRGAIGRAKLRRQIGVVFQEDNLLPDRSVYENAAAALTISGCARSQVREKTYQALRDVGLTAKAEQDVAALSSSERRLIIVGARAGALAASGHRRSQYLRNRPKDNCAPAGRSLKVWLRCCHT